MKQKYKILIVDDEPELRHLLSIIFEDSGFIVTTLLEPEKIIDQIKTSGIPDIILLDVVMPDISGWEVCDLLKKNPNTCNIPIVFLTVQSNSKDVERGFGLGAESYITKPFKPANLIQKVMKIIKKQ